MATDREKGFRRLVRFIAENFQNSRWSTPISQRLWSHLLHLLVPMVPVLTGRGWGLRHRLRSAWGWGSCDTDRTLREGVNPISPISPINKTKRPAFELTRSNFEHRGHVSINSPFFIFLFSWQFYLLSTVFKILFSLVCCRWCGQNLQPSVSKLSAHCVTIRWRPDWHNWLHIFLLQGPRKIHVKNCLCPPPRELEKKLSQKLTSIFFF